MVREREKGNSRVARAREKENKIVVVKKLYFLLIQDIFSCKLVGSSHSILLISRQSDSQTSDSQSVSHSILLSSRK